MLRVQRVVTGYHTGQLRETTLTQTPGAVFPQAALSDCFNLPVVFSLYVSSTCFGLWLWRFSKRRNSKEGDKGPK